MLLTLASEAEQSARGGGEHILVASIIILGTAGLVALVAQRLRLDLVPAYLIAGALVGPHALGLVQDPDTLSVISRTAIILLMFGIGLHMDLDVLRTGVVRLVAITVGWTALFVLLAWPISMALGLSAPAGLAVCLALSISSTAVVLRVLNERREMRRPVGRLSFAVLVLQDMLALLALMSIPALARWEGAGGGATVPEETGMMADAPKWAQFFLDAGIKFVAVAGIIVLGRWALPHVLREAAQGKSREVLIVLSTAIALGAALVTQAAGFSAELGAFLAGLMLAATPFRHQLAGQIGPLRDLFIAVFFTSVGMQIDAGILASGWWVVLLGVALTLALKTAVGAAACWAVGVSATTSAAVGLYLAQAGEFSLLLLQVANSERLITEEVLAKATAITAFTLILTPSLMTLGNKVRPLTMRIPPPPWIKTQLSDEVGGGHGGEEPAERAGEPLHLRHVVLAGFGVVGRAVSEKLDTMGVKFTIIEFNPGTVASQTRLGRSVVYGDVTNEDVLESAGVRRADAVILTIPDEDAVLRACQIVRSLNPRAFIAARTNFLSKGMLATSLGADHVTIEEIATAEAMAWEVTRQLAERAISGTNAPTTHVVGGRSLREVEAPAPGGADAGVSGSPAPPASAPRPAPPDSPSPPR